MKYGMAITQGGLIELIKAGPDLNALIDEMHEILDAWGFDRATDDARIFDLEKGEEVYSYPDD